MAIQPTQNNDFVLVEDSPDPGGNWLEDGINGAVRLIDKVSKLPKAISDTGDNLNDAFIESAQNIKERGGAKAEQNLRSGKIDQLFKQAGRWLRTGNNAFIALAVVGAIIFFMRK